MRPQTPNVDPVAIALGALATTLGDDRRAQRFLDLTGIGIDELKNGAADPVLLVALIAFLEAHEPDLIAVSEEMGVDPTSLSAARLRLEGLS